MVRTTTQRSFVLAAAATALLVLIVPGDPGAVADNNDGPSIEYMARSADYDLRWSASSGPDSKTENDSRLTFTVHTSAIHDHPRGLRFIVLALEGSGDQERHLRLNPASTEPRPDGTALPLSVRSDAVTTAIFFDKPWPPKQVREFDLELAIAPGLLSAVASVAFITHAAGYEPRDAIPLLGDPVLSEGVRSKVASWLAATAGRRYRHVTDDGRWVAPADVSGSLPLASPAEQVARSVLRYAGAARQGAEIEVTNTTDRTRSVWIAGGGRERWLKVAPRKTAILEVEDGLLALAIEGPRYVTHIEVIRSKSKYTLELD